MEAVPTSISTVEDAVGLPTKVRRKLKDSARLSCSR